MGKLLAMQAQRYAEHEAVVYPSENIRWTYSEFNAKVEQIAKGMIKIGIKKNDHVAIWATNVPEWLLCQLRYRC